MHAATGIPNSIPPRPWSRLSIALGITLVTGGLVSQSPAGASSAARTSHRETQRRYPLRLPASPHNYANPDLPRHFGRGLGNSPRHNPVTDHGATLGRVLFYDRRLSRNERVSCASCHLQTHGFSDPKRRSVGFRGGRTRRNSMGLANARYHPNGRFFWDERAATLEEQVLMPIQDKLEMGMTMPAVVARLSLDVRYGDMMQRAFGDREINPHRIARALAQFIRSIVSYRTKFDAGLAAAGDIDAAFSNFTKQENHGKSLFLGAGNCAGCHMSDDRGPGRGGPRGGPPRRRRSRPATGLFVTPRSGNNGLDAKIDPKDRGIGEVTGNSRDFGTFKVPSLRNIAKTAPYMHDGRLPTLRSVIDHYERGVKEHPNLDRRMRRFVRDGRRGSSFTSKDKAAMVAFLKTLTDHALAKDPKFGDPFGKSR